MLRTMSSLATLFLIVQPAGAADQWLAFTAAAKAGPDCLVQGEYVGKVQTKRGQKNCGVQVIAQGDGKFHAVAFLGGLPGAGWKGKKKMHADGETKGGVTVLAVENKNWSVRIKDGRMTVESDDGKMLGSLKRIERKSPTLGKKPPAGAIVLFDGTTVEKFKEGKMTRDRLLMEPATSKQTFQSFRSHVEFRTPYMPFARGQARANNGYFCQGRYQVQILDSFGLESAKGECGAIYGLAAPEVNMCFPPLSWQTFDVDFTAAVYKDGKKIKNARMTVYHNGVLVHDDLEVPATSAGALIKTEGPEPGPIFVQSHKAPLRFRNIWVVEKQ